MKLSSILASFAAASILVSAAPARAQLCTTSEPLFYRGGKIAATPKVAYVYWGITGTNLSTLQSMADPILNSTFDNSFGISGTRWWNQVVQYPANADRITNAAATPTNPSNILLGSDILDNHNVPTSALIESQVGAEVDYLVANNKIPGMTKDTIVMMFLPFGIAPPMAACGRHVESPNGNLYAWIAAPNQVAGCGTGWFEQAISHEIEESVMNPEWNLSTEAYDQSLTASCEIGDLCESQSFVIQTQTDFGGTGGYSTMQTQPFFSNEAEALSGQGCVSSMSTHAAIFGIGGNNALWVQTIFPGVNQAISMGNWTTLGSPGGNTVKLVQKPSGVAWGPNRMDAFALDTGGDMWHVSERSGALSWELLGYPAGTPFSVATGYGSPDAVSWGAGNLQVFAIASDYNIYRDYFDEGDGAWSGWQKITLPTGHGLPWTNVSVGSAMATNVTGAYPTDVHSLNIAYVDTNDQLEFGTIARYATAPTWNQSGLPFTGHDVDVSVWAPGRSDVFVRDTSGNLWDCVSTDQIHVGGCSFWGHPSDGAFDASAGAVGLGDGRLLVAGRVGGTGAEAAYFSFWDWNGATAFNGYQNGAHNGYLIGGLDVAAW